MSERNDYKGGETQNRRIRRFAEPAAAGAAVVSAVGAGLALWASRELITSKDPTAAEVVSRGLGVAAGLAVAYFGKVTADNAANQVYERNLALERDK